jgi:hypothetical protein
VTYADVSSRGKTDIRIIDKGKKVTSEYYINKVLKPLLEIIYDKQDRQGKAAFNERNPHKTQQLEPAARRPGDPKQKHYRAQDRRLFPESGGSMEKAMAFHQDIACSHTSKNAIFSQRLSN